jgi:hypothetical protein
MRNFCQSLCLVAAAVLVPLVAVPSSFAWGNEGHTEINQVAAQTLPSDVPAFLRTQEAINTIAYLGPEPDRWRNPAEAELVSAQAPEHFIDLELADMVGPLPRKRFDFIRDLYAEAVKHPEMAPQLAPDHVGLQPYVTIEVYERLKAAMRAYRQLSAGHKDTRPVELAITFYAGWLGHYVGDGSQPLHTSIQYNGWVGPNPNGYTTEHKIHWQFEGPFVGRNIPAKDFASLVPKTPHVLGDPFEDYVAYLRHSHTYVEKVYQLYKEGGFDGAGTPESRQFTEERLAAGATMLRDMIYTAWVRSGDPVVDPFAPKPAAAAAKEK